jgi:hypothetical protein
MEFMQFGFGYDLPPQCFSENRHPLLPHNSMESLEIIHDKIGISGLNNTVDVFCLESNLWDIQRYRDCFPHLQFEDYTNEWKKNATKMFQLVEHLFPKATVVWVSTCISIRDPRKHQAEYLNIAAKSILPANWIYLDVERVLNGTLGYRGADKYHLGQASTVPLVQHILNIALAKSSDALEK